MAKKRGNVIGAWAFLIGVVIAIVVGLIGISNQALVITLVVIGLIVGLLNIADDEAKPFLMSSVVLVIVSALGQAALNIIPKMSETLGALLILFVPAAVVVAIRNVFSLAKS